MMAPSPAASPSMPSKKFIALVMPTIQATVEQQVPQPAPHAPVVRQDCSTTPAAMTMAAQASWTKASPAGTSRQSSKIPVTKRTMAALRIAMSSPVENAVGRQRGHEPGENRHAA